MARREEEERWRKRGEGEEEREREERGERERAKKLNPPSLKRIYPRTSRFWTKKLLCTFIIFNLQPSDILSLWHIGMASFLRGPVLV